MNGLRIYSAQIAAYCPVQRKFINRYTFGMWIIKVYLLISLNLLIITPKFLTNEKTSTKKQFVPKFPIYYKERDFYSIK